MKLKRLVSVFFDYCLISLLLSPVLFSLEIGNNSNYYIFNEIPLDFYIFGIVMLVVFSFKDLVFRNASIGKRILKIQVLRKNGTVPDVVTLILRNIFIIMWPVEAILVLYKNQRIGDLVFKTKVVNKE